MGWDPTARGIMTSLNLFFTRFDQVMGFIEKRAPECKYAARLATLLELCSMTCLLFLFFLIPLWGMCCWTHQDRLRCSHGQHPVLSSWRHWYVPTTTYWLHSSWNTQELVVIESCHKHYTICTSRFVLQMIFVIGFKIVRIFLHGVGLDFWWFLWRITM